MDNGQLAIDNEKRLMRWFVRVGYASCLDRINRIGIGLWMTDSMHSGTCRCEIVWIPVSRDLAVHVIYIV